MEGNGREIQRIRRLEEELGMPSGLPELGPWECKDVWGMRWAILTLRRSMDPGRNEKCVQYDTIRKMRSAVTNIHQAAPHGLRDSIASYERSKLWITSVPTHSFWFNRFMSGFHKRIGQKRLQDEPVLIKTMMGMMDAWDQDWDDAGSSEEKLEVAMTATWFVLSFCGGFRGEEMIQIEEKATLGSIAKCKRDDIPHIEVCVSGETKGNRLRGSKFKIPIVWETGYSNISVGKWLERFGRVKRRVKGSYPRLFQMSERIPKLKDYHELFFGALQQAKDRGVPGFVEGELLREKYGILRSLRRGTTAHAKNRGVGTDLLNAVNRWRKHKNSQTDAPRLDMDEVYAQLEAIKPMILRFSQKL